MQNEHTRTQEQEKEQEKAASKITPVVLSRYRSRIYTDDSDVHRDNMRRLTLSRTPSKSRFFVQPELEPALTLNNNNNNNINTNQIK